MTKVTIFVGDLFLWKLVTMKIPVRFLILINYNLVLILNDPERPTLSSHPLRLVCMIWLILSPLYLIIVYWSPYVWSLEGEEFVFVEKTYLHASSWSMRRWPTCCLHTKPICIDLSYWWIASSLYGHGGYNQIYNIYIYTSLDIMLYCFVSSRIPWTHISVFLILMALHNATCSTNGISHPVEQGVGLGLIGAWGIVFPKPISLNAGSEESPKETRTCGRRSSFSQRETNAPGCLREFEEWQTTLSYFGLIFFFKSAYFLNERMNLCDFLFTFHEPFWKLQFFVNTWWAYLAVPQWFKIIYG